VEESNPKTYEECYHIIDKVVNKFHRKWRLKAINWFDFEDVAQVVKLHIFNKWHLWDQTQPLEPWVAQVSSNQIKNIIRNNYTNYVKPCMSCEFNMGEDQCSFTRSGTQNTTCDLYAKWAKQKRAGYGIKLPLSIENHTQEVDHHQEHTIDFEGATNKLNKLLKLNLSEIHYKVYIMLFFDDKSEEEVAKLMGYKTTEKNRKAGYKQIKNLKKMLKQKAIQLMSEHDIVL